jgi:transposase
MYIAVVPNRGSPPAVLLREGWREGKKTRQRTLANLTHLGLSENQIEVLRRALRGEALVPVEEQFEIVRTRPYGAVALVLGMARELGVPELLASRASRERELVLAMTTARVLEPRSKLATSRALTHDTLSSTLAEELSLGAVDVDELYEALDWLVAAQARIESKLARRHLHEGTLVLYDVTSTYFEGRHCPLARLGYSRDARKDGKKARLQIVFGLLTTAEGCPVAVEVFEGNTADPNTLAVQVAKVRDRFGLQHVVLVGDRGMITAARIRQDLRGVGLDWITALQAPQIQKLVRAGELQLSVFDIQDLAEITSKHFPGERLVVCKNPLLASERARKREELLTATQRELEKIKIATERKRGPLRGKAEIGVRVGRVLARYKMGKHFRVTIEEAAFDYERKQDNIEREAALDGLYVVRTSVPATALNCENAVRAYKALAGVERAFRCFKGEDLRVRPIFHRNPDRVRAHIFLCMLAYYVEWHLRRAVAPLLFQDDDRADAEARRRSIVSPAQRSAKAMSKAYTQQTDEGWPVHSFATLLRDLATCCKNLVRMGDITFERVTTPTPLQQRAFDLAGVPLVR